MDVTLQPTSSKAFKPRLNGGFSEPISKTKPAGFFDANSVRIFFDSAIGVATTITS